MDATSDVVLEHSKKIVSTKRVEEMSTTSSQQLSSTSLKEKSLIVASALNSSNAGTGSVVRSIADEIGTEGPVSLVLCGAPAGNVNNSSMESELTAMKITDDSGNEIGEMVQQKQKQQSVMSSSSVNTVDGSSSSSSTMKQQASISTIATESSSTSSSTTAEKSVCVEDEKKVESDKQIEADKPVEAGEKVDATPTLKTGETVVEDDTNNGNESVPVKESVTVLVKNDTEKSSTAQDDGEEIVEEEVEEEEVEEEDNECDSESAEKKVIEKVVETPDGSRTITTTTVISERSNPNVKSITTEVIKVVPKTQTITSITTTPPTPTNEETKPVDFETKPEMPSKADIEEELEEEEEDTEEEDDEEEVEVEVKIPTVSVQQQQQLHEDKVLQEAAPQQAPTKDVTDSSTVSSLQNKTATKQGNLNNTIMDIISSIDSNIIAEENNAALKQRDLELLKKQQELALEIQKQQLLAQKLANENRILQQQQKELQLSNNKTEQILSQKTQPITNVSKYSTYDETQDENKYSRRTETIETRESTNVSKKIDLQKIFSPAADAEEILPKNRKLYASSAFYSPSLHPTVEDQVELARKISHSLSDVTNHQSKGQSMYVNRKKRSVKWVHEGCGQGGTVTTSVESQNIATDAEDSVKEDKENDGGHTLHCDKIPLKFLMNPRGQMRDINSCQESINTETGLLSLDTSAEVVNALQTHKGKGAELFAKRRKVSENWVVDESNVGTQSPSGLPDYHQFQQQTRPSTSPSILPAFTDAAKHRVQLNMHQEQLLEKYARPGLKVVKTPWEAVLESGSANAAFVEDQPQSPYQTPARSPAPQYFDARQGGQSHEQMYAPTVADTQNKPFSPDSYKEYRPQQQQQQYKLPQVQTERRQAAGTNPQRDLAYKPSIPQGWKAPNMSLPSDLLEYAHQQDTFNKDIEQTSWEIERIQQEQQISTIINEAAEICKAFNMNDEKEIIDIVRDVKLATVTEPSTSSFIKKTLCTKMPEHTAIPKISPTLKNTQAINNSTVSDIKTTRSSHQNNDKNTSCCGESVGLITNSETNVEPEEEYVKVPVRELITNFEQQCQKEIDIRKPQHQTKSNYDVTIEEQPYSRSEMYGICESNEDLYVPKEIPLQSYVSPPVAAMPPSLAQGSMKSSYDSFEHSWKPSNPPQNTYQPPASVSCPSPVPSHTPTAPFGGSGSFPLNKTSQMGFSTSCGNNQVPKQQYLTPQSYQSVPQTTAQNAPQLNFSPSPLPYEKLAKFENSTGDLYSNESRRTCSPPRTAHLGSKDHNASAAPFVGSYQQRAFTPSLEYNTPARLSPRPPSFIGGNITPTPHTTFNTSQLLHAPSYNSSARGWQSSAPSTGYQAQQQRPMISHKPHIVNTSSMPYTDF